MKAGGGGCRAADISKGVTAFLVLYFAAIAAASIGILISKINNPPGYWYKKMIKQATLEQLRRKAEASPGKSAGCLRYSLRLPEYKNTSAGCLRY